MTKNNLSTYYLLQRLINPKEVLDARLFDYNQKLNPEVKDFVIKNLKSRLDVLLEKIEGIEIHDIYLTGSTASYFYHEQSNIDIRVDIRNVSCKHLSKDDEFLSRFLTSCYSGAFDKHKLRLGTQDVTVTISSGMHERLPFGVYSVLNDKWVIEPQKDITKDLDASAVQTEYERRYNGLEKHLIKMKESSDLKTLVGINALKKLHKEILASNNVSVGDYIIYKMLNYSGIIKEIEATYNQALKKFLSLTD